MVCGLWSIVWSLPFSRLSSPSTQTPPGPSQRPQLGRVLAVPRRAPQPPPPRPLCGRAPDGRRAHLAQLLAPRRPPSPLPPCPHSPPCSYSPPCPPCPDRAHACHPAR